LPSPYSVNTEANSNNRKTSVAWLILAAGHDEWDIQNILATGKVISELALDKKAISADISGLDPGKVIA
jgi:hypothetical protein